LQADQSIVITLSPRYDTGLHFEKKYIAANGVLTGTVEYEHYLYAGGMMFGKLITTTTTTTTTATDGVTLAITAMEYYSKDNLGSIIAITDGTGAVTQRLSYDVWGKRRYPNGAADPNGLLNNPDMYHGFTGHEMLDDVGLIHMNGRLYDPVMGRFVSADFLIPDAADLQYYNRYSYVGNNPLSLTDASGQCPWCIIAIISAVTARAAGIIDTRTARGIIGIAAGAWLGGVGGLLNGGFTNAVITGGIVGGISSGWNGVAGGAFSAGLFYGAGTFSDTMKLGGGSFGRAMAHAVAGCVGASATGGNCGNGALSAGFAEFAGPKLLGNWGDYGNIARQAIVGGTASVLGGGKFGNGAMTGAFGYLFNCSQHPGACTPEENRADMKAIREKETASALGVMNDAKGFVRGLTGADGTQGLSKSLKVVSDGADYVTMVAVAVPVIGEPVAATSEVISLTTGGTSALLSKDTVRNALPIAAGAFASKVSGALGATWRQSTGLGLAAQNHMDSVVNP
jgi:RHS repeat-associated protein